MCRAPGIYILNSRRPKVNTKIEERIREYVGDDPDKLTLLLAQAVHMAGEHGCEEQLARAIIAHGGTVALLADYYNSRATELVEHDIDVTEHGEDFEDEDCENGKNCEPVGCTSD